jgi:hypothetical protein
MQGFEVALIGVNTVVFSRVVVAAFNEFIHKFIEVYLDYWTIFNLLKYHIETMWFMINICRQ